MTTAADIGWGIIGPGEIAHRFAGELPESETGTLVAVASRSIERAENFAATYEARASADYDELLNDSEVQAVYIATVHTEHADWAIKAARAGKHVLCEKPVTPHAAETMAVLEAAREAGTVFLEGYMYLQHPRTALLIDLLRKGSIGEVRHIEATYAFAANPDVERLFSPELAGGAILDVGGYPLSFSLAVAEAVLGWEGRMPFTPPSCEGTAVLSRQAVDLWSTAQLRFPGDLTANLTAGIAFKAEHHVRVTGTEGFIELPSPWLPPTNQEALVEMALPGGRSETLTAPASYQYAREADRLAALTRDSGEVELERQRTEYRARLTQMWREKSGVRYPRERVGAPMPKSLRAVPAEQKMRYGMIPTSDKKISRLVLGCDNQPDAPFAAVMFDDFFAHGGNAFDTAYEYNDRVQQKLLGQWIEDRGVREEVFLIGKGAHTPYCDPENLESQLLETLEDLRTDHLDMYFVHRDNEDIPVDEFVDVLDTYYKKGVLEAYGGSNWSLERFVEANAYAAKNHKQPFTALSNHFGLAKAKALPWEGCRHVTDAESKRWLEKTQVPVFAWASQARGFFVRARPDDRSDAELVRCFYSEENFERQRRVRQLAAERGVSEAGVALAHVLHQPFETFALFGPRTLSESRTSMEALDIALDVATVRWLDLREE